MRGIAFMCAVGLAACSPQPAAMIQGDSTATAALLDLTDAQFFAQTQLARQVSDACATIGFNQRFNEALINHRYGGSNQRLVATANSRAVDLEKDVATRSLQARYDVVFDQESLCVIGNGEIARQSALSAVLVPI